MLHFLKHIELIKFEAILKITMAICYKFIMISNKTVFCKIFGETI